MTKEYLIHILKKLKFERRVERAYEWDADPLDNSALEVDINYTYRYYSPGSSKVKELINFDFRADGKIYATTYITIEHSSLNKARGHYTCDLNNKVFTIYDDNNNHDPLVITNMSDVCTLARRDGLTCLIRYERKNKFKKI